jgi:RNA polymerase sigma-70 factor, ECF subfamily
VSGPDEDFLRSIEPHRRAVRLHCYRMLGSAQDADDVVQETLLRAWRGRGSLQDPALVRPWLYRIATNASLDELRHRPGRRHPADAGPPMASPTWPVPPAPEQPWLEPVPETWLPSEAPDPAARYTLKESVALAFVAVLQTLSPVQRATLLLRDVLGFSAEETAATLELTVSAANSALFRARTTVEERVGGESSFAGAAVDEELLTQYVRAFEDGNVDALLSLLHAEVRTTMPPLPTWVDGWDANAAFYRPMFATMERPIHIARIAANGQPAFAFYRGTPLRLRAIQLVAFRNGRIVAIDHFMLPRLFPLFGLPELLP